jgi:hypothetical protein
LLDGNQLARLRNADHLSLEVIVMQTNKHSPSPRGRGGSSNEGIVVHGGTLTSRQIVVGSGAHGTYTEAVGPGAEAVDIAALRTALKELRTSLGQANLSDDVLIGAQTAAGSAIVEGLQGERVTVGALEEHLRQVAATLKESNVSVHEGSELWRSVQKLAPLVGPLIAGGARAVAAWFGVPM